MPPSETGERGAAGTDSASDSELGGPVDGLEADTGWSPDGPRGPDAPLPVYDDGFVQPRLWVRPAHEGKVRLGVWLFAALIFLPNLGAFGLWDPWETHYGAVTTNMIETYDWVSPWWGYKEQIGTEARQGNHFFSKPVFIFWSEAVMAKTFGRGEWAIRMPMALLAMLAVFAIYWMASKIWTRRIGLLAAFLTATAPQFFMISRQAQTDMPFVATLVVCMAFLMVAFFGPRQELSRRGFWSWIYGTLGFVLLNTLPQFAIIWTDLDQTQPEGLAGVKLALWTVREQGWAHVLIYAAVLVVLIASFARSLRRELKDEGLSPQLQDRWRRKMLLVIAFAMAAQSTYAKGLLGFMLPGAIVLAYLVVSHAWRLLGREELLRGLGVFLVVGLPWYVAMFAKHGMAYYQRFFIHDHFNRLGAGVHQIDSGTFEHFIKWLGIGLFPFAVFAPLAILWALRVSPRSGKPSEQARLFTFTWFAVAFALFTVSSTKFHHYIFPAMPALTVLTALFVDRLLEDRGWMPRLAVVVGIGFFAALAWDLHEDPQHVRNLMTYKYDRPLPAHLPIDADAPVAEGSELTWKDSVFWRHTSPTLHSVLTTETFRYDRWIPLVTFWGLLALMLCFATRSRRAGLAALGALATAFAMWSLNYYMPSLSPHWSQKYLFDSYYDTCELTDNPQEIEDAYRPVLASIGLDGLAQGFRSEPKRVCKEDVISWLITWRGETYYSYNELQPITKEQPQFMPYLEERNQGEKFYALMERGKLNGFKSKLKSYSDKLKRKGLDGWKDIESWDVNVECDESLYFLMVSATPVTAASK